MDISRKRKTTKCLFILWIVSFVIVAICSNTYVIYTMVTTGTSPITMLSTHQILILTICLFLFYPLLFLIYHNAKIAEMRRIMICAKIGIVFFSIWNAIAIIITTYACLNPDVF